MRAGVRTVVGGALALAVGAAALAQPQIMVIMKPADAGDGFAKIKVKKAALGPSQILVWGNGQIDPDCHEHQPGATLSVLRPPQHGTVKVVHEDDYLAYLPPNPRTVCNQRKVPVNHAYYAANPGYVGRDEVVLQGSSSDGRVREITVDIDVR
jgi:hypothetical protein